MPDTHSERRALTRMAGGAYCPPGRCPLSSPAPSPRLPQGTGHCTWPGRRNDEPSEQGHRGQEGACVAPAGRPKKAAPTREGRSSTKAERRDQDGTLEQEGCSRRPRKPCRPRSVGGEETASETAKSGAPRQEDDRRRQERPAPPAKKVAGSAKKATSAAKGSARRRRRQLRLRRRPNGDGAGGGDPDRRPRRQRCGRGSHHVHARSRSPRHRSGRRPAPTPRTPSSWRSCGNCCRASERSTRSRPRR